ncbi:MAG: cation:proton antiporter [Chthoniobacterales bacterium]
MTPFQLSIQFFLQLAFILTVCRIVGWIAGKLGQPQVVGEMIAGVVMGPSIFGALAPHAQSLMFPEASKPILFSFCQVGLVLYMFLIGTEFNFSLITSRIRSAASVSISGICVPFLFGAVAAYFLIGSGTLFSEQATKLEAMLFLGAAMSITAFPMLARIIYERGLTGTSLGTLALAAGSIDDAAAWCVLAVVLASFAGKASIAFLAIGGGLAYVLFVFIVARPLLKIPGRMVEKRGELSSALLSFTLCVLMLCAWFTDFIHIYAVFGAFLIGMAIPRGKYADELKRLLEPITTCFMLPLFFVYSGLSTNLLLLFNMNLLGIGALLLFLAILGKGGACYLAARLNGETQRESLAIGALMNSRGLMELIILNIGLERGIITPALFTILVIMAIVTTLMATPLFEWIYGRKTAVIDRKTVGI